MNRHGFTLVEMTIALVILMIGVLGITASAASLGRASAVARSEAIALQAVNDRLSLALMHPNYVALDSLYTSTESDMPEDGFTRTTEVARTQTPGENGKTMDFTRITVSVTGPGLDGPVVRSHVVAAP